MLNLSILILAFVSLYTLSRIFTQKLFVVLVRITGNREKASTLLGWIFLPGTFVHEVSHLLMAILMLVPVGQITLMPVLVEGGINLGSVQVGKSDFIRGSLIGLSPIIVGLGIIYWSVTLAFSSGQLDNPWLIAALIYLIFEITHTMFSSKRDLYAVFELIVFVLIVAVALIVLKIYDPFIFLSQKIQDAGILFQKLSQILLIPITLELVFLAIFRKIKI
jgi:hypothetical protein